jgi:hypothetical protein
MRSGQPWGNATSLTAPDGRQRERVRERENERKRESVRESESEGGENLNIDNADTSIVNRVLQILHSCIQRNLSNKD